ncbi:IS110 family transposase [Paenibacillus spongiae]|uniref:IS110 family transposase n=1 Tax=Paenibacillus spongiae TaxID=2909671 RepID=A0ABY5S6Q8_9BACL|nr:IS110 family transposase [Paenibacillus spongiae]UVI29270.1 IS110 family transposase [Paenibacillus spongiae]
MNPVIGLDIAKGESQGQAFLDKGQPYGKSFTVHHTHEGLEAFYSFLKLVEEETEQQPMIILESTGHYHLPVTRFLEDHNFLFVVVNPILSYQAKKSSSLRKVKTDAVDAYALCELFYKEDFEHHKTRGVQLLNLRNLTRQHDAVTGLYIQIKLQFQAVLDQVFPEYRGVFGDLHSAVALKTLLEFPTSDAVLRTGKAKISEKIASLCMRRSERWAMEKAEALLAAAERNPFRKAPFQSHLISLEMYVSMLLHYREHLSALEKQMNALANDIEEYQIIQSIPGIGEKIAATIISEIGEIDRFNHPMKLVAFAGVDPSVHISGKFTATINRITKRGSSRLRHTLFLAVLCSLRRSGIKKMKAFYDKKIADGKPHKVAMIACVNKMFHWIFALLKRKETFLDLA